MKILAYIGQFRIIALLLVVLSACQQQEANLYTPTFADKEEDDTVEYTFSVHPLHNPQRLFDVFNPLMTYLSSQIDGVKFKLEASRNYAAYNEKLYAKQADFSLPNPFQTINAIDRGYRVFAKMGDDDNFRGIILVRKDSGIKRVRDLRGKAVSYPAPTALAATMMPQYYLQTHGLNVLKDLDNRYVGSQESSIMNVFLGHTAAGSTWPPPWRALSKERPELARELEVIWRTDPLPNNGLVVLPSVNPEVTKQVQKLLTTLHTHPQGQEILSRMELSRFEVASEATYQPVRDFVRDFETTVRPLQ